MLQARWRSSAAKLESFVPAERAPAEHAAQPFDSIAERDPVRIDSEFEEAFFVIALPHLEHVEAAPELGLDLDVSEEEDVVEDEREAAEVGALAKCGHLVREDCRAPDCTNEASQRPHVGGQTLILPSRKCELSETVDDDALDVSACKVAAHEGAGLIEVDLHRRDVPNNELVWVDARPVPAGGGGFLSHFLVGLLEGDVQTPLALLETGSDEAQRHQRLADSRGADEERRVAARDASGDRGVEFVEAEGRSPVLGRYQSRQGRLQAREDLEAGGADPEAVLARDALGAARLQDAKRSPVDGAACFVFELDDSVGDGKLRQGASLCRGVLADKDQDGICVGDLAGEVVDGATEAVCIDDVVERLAEIDHDHRRFRFEALAQDLVACGSESVCSLWTDQLGEMDELKRIAERVGLEEFELLEMPHDLLVRL